MKPEAIPILELILPDSVAVPNFTSDDVYRLLAHKVLRGRLIGDILFTISIAGLAASLLISPNTPWAIASVLGCALFGYVFYRSRQKLDLAQRIATEPQLVYWAHPTILRQKAAGQVIDTNFMTLHSSSGTVYEVAMPHEQMLSMAAWFRHRNPNIRLGAYDNQAQAPNDRTFQP